MRYICDVCGNEFDRDLDSILFGNLFEGNPEYDDLDECMCFRCATLRTEEDLCEQTRGMFTLD